MDWLATIEKLAPTVAAAALGPLGGGVVAAIGAILGQDSPTAKSISDAIQSGQLTPEQIAAIRQLELKYQNDEKERGFRYEELKFKDRDSARQANVSGGTQKMLFWLSLLLLAVSIGAEVFVLFAGIPGNADPLVIGRVLGLLDSVALLVLNYWYGSSSGSTEKTQILAGSK